MLVGENCALHLIIQIYQSQEVTTELEVQLDIGATCNVHITKIIPATNIQLLQGLCSLRQRLPDNP